MDQATQQRPLPTPEEVFREYGPRVYSLARRMLGNDADAEDVTQDVLVQVVRKLKTFRGDANLSTWLHRVTINAALTHRRKRARRAEHEVHDPLQQYFEQEHRAAPKQTWEVTPEKALESRETTALIERAIERLPEPYRDVYVLADVEGLSNAEIGDALDLTVSAVKNRLHRGRLMMRNELAPHFEKVKS
jgi:RNA polymerase sigma-70 factor (ECF subfamily)